MAAAGLPVLHSRVQTMWPTLLRGPRWIQRQGVSPAIRIPPRSCRKRTQPWSRRLEAVCCSALVHVIHALWHDMLRACSAVEVFDFFHSAGLATHS